MTPISWRTGTAALRELLLMQRALTRAAASGDSRRAGRRALAEARDHRIAAEVLLLDGRRAEAIGLGAAAGAAMTQAMAPLPELSTPDRRRERADAFRRALDQLGPPPLLDADTTPGQADRLRALLVAQSELERELLPDLRDREEIIRERGFRWFLAVLVGAGIWVAGSVAHWVVSGTRVHASDELTPLYAADRALDGDAETDWVAGSRDPWLEIAFRSRRRLHHLAILNGHVLPSRAASRVLVQCFERNNLVRDWQAELGEGSAVWPVSVNVAGATCDRLVLRPLAESLLRSAAISEITFD